MMPGILYSNSKHGNLHIGNLTNIYKKYENGFFYCCLPGGYVESPFPGKYFIFYL